MSNKPILTKKTFCRRMVSSGLCLVVLALLIIIASTQPAMAFGTHPPVTEAALVLYTNTNTLTALSQHSNIGDTGLALVQSAPHYDNNHWSEGQAWIQEHRQEAVNAAYRYYVTGHIVSLEEFFDNIGYVLHATQDFYAHSNWIEEHNWGVIANLEGSKPSGWKSGKFPGYGEEYHSHMNKDDSSRTGYAEAYADAILATQDQIELFKSALASSYPESYDSILIKLGFYIYKPAYVDSALSWPNGKIYFFKGSNYIRYDWTQDQADSGYPAQITGAWPGIEGWKGIGAAFVAPNNKTYFFQGDSYYRYDITADRVDDGYPRSIAGNWPGLWSSGIDAAVLWPNGKIYFFKGSNYIRYDWNNDCADSGYPRSIAENWPGLEPFAARGIDAVEVKPDQKKAYFFSGDYYIRYDIEKDCADEGYPLRIQDQWPGL